MCHVNSTESKQSCRHFGALNLSYTLPFLFYQVLIFTWVKWSIWGLSALPKDTTSKQCPNIERAETWYFSENPAPSGIRNRTAGSDIGKAPRSNIVPWLSLKHVQLKGLVQAKIIKKSVILFWLLNMTIWCKHVNRLELQKFFNFCAAHLSVRLDIETKFPYFLFLTWLPIIRNQEFRLYI